MEGVDSLRSSFERFFACVCAGRAVAVRVGGGRGVWELTVSPPEIIRSRSSKKQVREYTAPMIPLNSGLSNFGLLLPKSLSDQRSLL